MQHIYYTKDRLHKEQILTQSLLTIVEDWLATPKENHDFIVTEYYPRKADEIYLKLYGYKCEFDDYYLRTKILPIC